MCVSVSLSKEKKLALEEVLAGTHIIEDTVHCLILGFAVHTNGKYVFMKET
jgi:hypothetical protein